MQQTTNASNPLDDFIPDKKYFTIGEISHFTGVKAHVLRYWEQVVPMLEPTKRSGRRYYQRQDLLLVMEIDRLVHQEGHTLQGALGKLKTQGLPDGLVIPVKPALRGKKPNMSLDKLESQLKIMLLAWGARGRRFNSCYPDQLT